MSRIAQITKPLLCTALVVACTLVSSAREKTLDELKAEAEKASGGHQAQLCATIAERLVDVANQQFDQGDSVKGQQTVQEILAYAVRAHDAALESHRKLKEVEIHLRETQRRLEGLKRTLSADDRPPLEAVEKKLADFRDDLLNAMFAPRKKEKKP